MALALASGCAGQKLGKQTVKVKHYPDCYQPITDMRNNATKLNHDVIKGAVAGAVVGALIGALKGGDAKGAAIGALAGAAVGAATAYLISETVQSKQQAERLKIYNQSLDLDISNLKQAVAAARIADNCYYKQYQQLERDYKAGRVSKAEMLEKLEEIKAGTSDAITILENYRDSTADNQKTYDAILAMETKRDTDRISSSAQSNFKRKKAAQAAEGKSTSNFIAHLDSRRTTYAQRSEALAREENGRPDFMASAMGGAVLVPCTI
jgi:uncharacterized protein YcfJ